MVPAVAHILGLAELGSSGKTISKIAQFLCSPSQKLCDGMEAAATESSEELSNDKPQTKPRAKAAAPRKNVKKAREPAPQPEEEPSAKRQRGPRAGKQNPVAKKLAEKKKASKRKAAEVEQEPEAAPEEALEEHAALQAEPEGAEGDEVEADVQNPDVEMEDDPEEPMQQEGEEEEAQEYENDEEPAQGLAMHPWPAVIGGPPVHEQPLEDVPQDQNVAYDGVNSQDEDGEEPEPPPPGLENENMVAACAPQNRSNPRAAAPGGAPAVPTCRPAIGSQASPCDAGPPTSHGRSQPPQLGPHALQPPLEGVATSGGRVAMSHDNGSVTKARARATNKRATGRTAAANKSNLCVGASAGTVKKAAAGSKRGAQAVLAAAKQVSAVKQVPAVRCQPTEPTISPSCRVYVPVMHTSSIFVDR